MQGFNGQILSQCTNHWNAVIQLVSTQLQLHFFLVSHHRRYQMLPLFNQLVIKQKIRSHEIHQETIQMCGSNAYPSHTSRIIEDKGLFCKQKKKTLQTYKKTTITTMAAYVKSAN